MEPAEPSLLVSSVVSGEAPAKKSRRLQTMPALNEFHVSTLSPRSREEAPGRAALEVKRELTRRVVSNKTLAHNTRGGAPGVSGDIISYPEENTRMAIGQMATAQYSLEDLVTQSRFATPHEFKRAVSRIGVAAKDPQAVRSLAKISAATIAECELEFKTDATKGLSAQQVELNRNYFGANCIKQRPRRHWWKLLIGDLTSPLVVFLVLGCIVSMVFREWAEAVAIVLLITLNTISSTMLQSSASRALEALASMNAPSCDVIRDGARTTVPAADIVVGDIVMLASGMSVPADLRLIECQDLTTNESLLTGESEDIHKTADLPRALPDESPAFPPNLCYDSTLVTGGSGKAICFAVGMQTQMGLIAATLLEEAPEGKRTPLELALDKLGGIIGIIVVVVLATIMITAWLTNYEDPSRPDRSQFVTLVVLAVGFAVSAMPEALPTVVTTCFSMGCQTLNKQHAKVRRLPAVETLGCTSVICTDKTGTLTQARMVADTLALYLNHTIFRYKFFPLEGFNPSGGIVAEDDLATCQDMLSLGRRLRRDSVKERSLAPGDLSFDSVRRSSSRKPSDGYYRKHPLPEFSDPVETMQDFGNPRNESFQGRAVRLVMLVARLATPKTEVKWNSSKNDYIVTGNATDAALVVGAAKARWSEALGHVNPFHFFKLQDSLSVPFNSTRKIQFSVFSFYDRGRVMSLDLGQQAVAFAVVKGAPEIIIERSVYSLRGSTNSPEFAVDSEFLNSEQKLNITRQNLVDSQHAMRVLGLAMCVVDEPLLRALLECETSDMRLDRFLNEPLVFLGLISSRDPPKAHVGVALKECQSAQVRVVIITGDQINTVVGLTKHLDMPDAEAITCEGLSKTDGDLADWETQVDEITAKYSIFCRARPEDKLTIVQSLQRQGHVVAMTGDGVNDAPALQMADIGVAMGITGTDVAKGASDLVLMDDNFATIVTAIREGRRVFANCQKFIAYLIGTDFGEVIYLTLAILIGLKLPLDALQVLFVNLICDAPPAISLAKEPAEDNVMKKHPRPRGQPILTREYWIYAIVPHVVNVCIIVLLGTLLFTYFLTGVWTAKAVDQQCLLVGSSRYYCQTSEYKIGTGWVTSIDYFNQGKLHMYMGIIPGKFTHVWLTPEDVGLNRTSFHCTGRQTDELGWCHPLPGFDEDTVRVNVRGSRMASTMTFVMAAFSEILWPYSIRSWLPLHSVFNRSPWLHIGAALPASLTMIVTVIPYIREVMGLHPIDFPHVGIALGFALVVTLLDEALNKPAHTWRHDY